MAKPHKKRVKVKRLQHNLKDKHIKTRVKGHDYDNDDATMPVVNVKKIKKQKQQPVKVVQVKKDNKKKKK